MAITDPTDIADLLFWHKGDAGVTASSGAISQWDDQSGNGYHLVQAGAGKPTVGATQNGLATVEFTAANSQYFTFTGGGNPLAGANGAHIFAMLKCRNDPPATDPASGLWRFGSSGSAEHYPYTNSFPYLAFGRGDRPQTKNPNTNLAGYHVLSVQVGYDIWAARVNWESILRGVYVDAEFTPAWATDAEVGRTANTGIFFDGFFAELVCFERPLTLREEFDMLNYLLIDRWAAIGANSSTVRMTAMRAEVLYDDDVPNTDPVAPRARTYVHF